MGTVVKRSYAQFCPVARTLDVVGDRWTLLIVRELLTGAKRYTDLKATLPGMGSNLLAQRLRELEAAEIVGRAVLPPPAARTVYELTARGHELESVLAEIARFGLPYLDVPTEDEPLNPGHIPLALRALVRTEELTGEELTITFVMDEGSFVLSVSSESPPGKRVPPRDRMEVTSAQDDGEDEARSDVLVRSSLAALLWIRRGDIDLDDAEAKGLLEIRGPTEKVAATMRLLTRTVDQGDTGRIASTVGS